MVASGMTIASVINIRVFIIPAKLSTTNTTSIHFVLCKYEAAVFCVQVSEFAFQ